MRRTIYRALVGATLCSQAVLAQLVQQGTKLVGSGEAGAAWQASAVAVSADGNTAIVGGYLDGAGAGAAWIFARSAGVWTQQGAKLIGGGASGSAQQGWSVAISGDGNTAIVGGPADNSGLGATWVFVRSAGAWSQQGGKLVGSGASGHSGQGFSVSLSADGSTAIVGGPNDASDLGAAWVFTRSGGVWKQQGAKLVGTGATGSAGQGSSVAVSGDAGTLVVGGPGDDNGAGASWVFTQQSGGWKQQGGKLTGSAPDTAFTITGDASVTATFTQRPPACESLALRVNPRTGGSVVANTPPNCSGGYLPGTEVSLTVTPDTNWSFAAWSATGGSFSSVLQSLTATFAITGNAMVTAELVAQSTVCAPLAVAVNPPGAGAATALTGQDCTGGYTVGTPVALSAAPAQGWVFSGWSGSGGVLSDLSSPVSFFTVSESTATATANFSPPSLACDSLAVASSPPAGGSVTVGTTPNCGSGYIQGGVVSLVADPAPGWAFAGWSGSGGSFSNPVGVVPQGLQGSSVAIAGDGNTMVVGGSVDGYPKGAIWVFTRTSGVWLQQGNPIAVSGQAGLAEQQWAVSISTDGNTVLAAEPGDGGGLGAAWVFVRSGATWSQEGAKLVGAGAAGYAELGAGAALSGDGSTAIVGGPDDAGGTGAAWIFAAGAPSPACAFGLAPASSSFPASGGTGTSTVTAPSGSTCPWVAISGAPWITVVGANGGSGSGVLTYAVDANSGAARSGTITVAAQVLEVRQAAFMAGLQAAFAFTPARPVVGGLVEFADASVGTPMSWSWSFGDGAASTAENPVHAYASPGTYTVTLTVTSAVGSSSASQGLTVASGSATWVPVVSRGAGLGGSVWRSDVALLNPGSAAASVEGVFHGPGGVATGSVEVPAGGEVLVKDVVGQLGSQGTGALEVLSDQPVVVASRTYDVLASGTVGQGYAGYGAAACLGEGASAWLPGLTENAAYRTDISVVNTGGQAATVAVTLLDGSGRVLASFDVALAPGESVQEERPFFTRGGQTALDLGYAEVTVTSGGGIIASASVVDNLTNDPTTVEMGTSPL